MSSRLVVSAAAVTIDPAAVFALFEGISANMVGQPLFRITGFAVSNASGIALATACDRAVARYNIKYFRGLERFIRRAHPQIP
ncbi:hypothetical protein [Caballeronia sp. BCC1704]|uniref:hypothetical protein n=1 Tax=Caballeronia sp. BCC1704 TaxID=2676300 RepID=UPI00158E12D9|nr:hypothetical protein [Caballeronia sp. BCC1704]